MQVPFSARTIFVRQDKVLPQILPFATTFSIYRQRFRTFTQHANTSSSTHQGRQSYISKNEIHYRLKEILQGTEFPSRRVYLASGNGGRNVILKYIHDVNYSYLEREIYTMLHGYSEHVRIFQDTIPEESMFVFNYFTGHLLNLVRKDLPLATIKTILREALLGIAEIHDEDIVHTDIKADNVFINWEERPEGIIIKKVQISDLEDAAHLPPGSAVIGKQAGNYMWRSPEAHACGPIEKPSDIFSFAIVMIYALTKRVIFSVSDEELDNGKLEPMAIVIDRQMSFFGELDSINEFIENHLAADNPYGQVFQMIRDGFGKDHPRMPFKLSTALDEDFKDLVAKMTDFNPAKRITAREVLKHPWFGGVNET